MSAVLSNPALYRLMQAHVLAVQHIVSLHQRAITACQAIMTTKQTFPWCRLHVLYVGG